MLKRLSLYTLLLCFVPIFAWLSHWQWQENETNGAVDYFLYLVTETGSLPYALLTCAFFIFLYFRAIKDRKTALWIIALMLCSIGLTQGIKSGLKTLFAEPRPFVVAMEQHSEVDRQFFYNADRKSRAYWVRRYYSDLSLEPQSVPSWLIEHRAKETGYSFPSGHSIFAASWLMLAVGFSELFGKQAPKIKKFVPVIAIWALLILISRLRLGMHYPIDLGVSILIAWLLHLGLFAFLQKKLIFRIEK
ncbi:phosphatase PAP2 family protein [Caviibacterium pharyngocola]|uniref:undecaprenyl-diphosphate phosphatase n=1 Tax=Caviibacterium pharyngocola TaxID=28159 RepID=A0A2M8RWN8_9PAST|nr:phosphatase PAP2 family protein [Caviibacterium pharyngocola]PJG83304.1 hypothetical protein CVP04_04060 [Caviibacterium pharyngocola]